MEVEESQDQQQKDTTPEDYPKVGERPDTEEAYDFKKEVAWLPFQLNLGDAPFNKEQQDWLLSL